ncbi:hypothetical protein M8818_006798 [Zalaria obscura]|uniref:Uncharacterized protein n=1 Tax=Zalaria obscura TaxID=2024903 RepID=A0ACC3S5K7_9PEZI
MAPTDPKQGGSLSDMAVDGTSMPNDAGVQNTIPSVPRPDQTAENPGFDAGSLGSANTAGAADNATDMPRSTKDIGATGEVITGQGDQIPAQGESKRLHFGANDPLAKGHDRYDKHARQKESDLERYAGEGAEVTAAPGEEEDGQDVIRDRKGL